MRFQFDRATWGLVILLEIGQVLVARGIDKTAIIAIRGTLAAAPQAKPELENHRTSSRKHRESRPSAELSKYLLERPRFCDLYVSYYLSVSDSCRESAKVRGIMPHTTTRLGGFQPRARFAHVQ